MRASEPTQEQIEKIISDSRKSSEEYSELMKKADAALAESRAARASGPKPRTKAKS